jgi:hypothetical protein
VTEAVSAATSSSFFRSCISSISIRLFCSSIAVISAEKSSDMSIGFMRPAATADFCGASLPVFADMRCTLHAARAASFCSRSCRRATTPAVQAKCSTQGVLLRCRPTTEQNGSIGNNSRGAGVVPLPNRGFKRCLLLRLLPLFTMMGYEPEVGRIRQIPSVGVFLLSSQYYLNRNGGGSLLQGSSQNEGPLT